MHLISILGNGIIIPRNHLLPPIPHMVSAKQSNETENECAPEGNGDDDTDDSANGKAGIDVVAVIERLVTAIRTSAVWDAAGWRGSTWGIAKVDGRGWVGACCDAGRCRDAYLSVFTVTDQFIEERLDDIWVVPGIVVRRALQAGGVGRHNRIIADARISGARVGIGQRS